MSNDYVKSLSIDSQQSKKYFEKSVIKTEQQKFLETLLSDLFTDKQLIIADIACGGGTLSYHLSEKFPNSQFYLSDLSEEALGIAKQINADKKGFHFNQSDINTLPDFADDDFDLVFCWQTLSWLDNAAPAVDQLIRIAKPGGKIYCSSLFNIDHDVDVYSKVVDHTRPSAEAGLSYNYSTFSAITVNKWMTKNHKVKSFRLHPFNPSVPFNYDGRGIGTNTVLTADNKYLQVSGGMLLNWAILEISL